MLQGGRVFGPDVTEYLYTAHEYLHHAQSTFSYPYPLLPLLYTPIVVAFPTFLGSYQAGDVSVGVVTVFLGLAAYAFLRRLTEYPLAGAIGAATLSTQPILIAEAGWTGLAQFVAFGFGLLGLTLLVRLGSDLRWRIAGLAGAMFLLAALSEPFSAAYFVLAGVAYAVLRWRARLFDPGTFLRLSAVFVPAILGAVSLDLAYPQVAQAGLHQVLLEHLGSTAAWHSMFTVFVQSNWYLWGLYGTAVATFVIMRWRFGSGLAAERPMLPALLVALVPQVLILTPYLASNRAIYFAAIPIALVAARLAQMTSDSTTMYAAAVEGGPSSAEAGAVVASEAPESASPHSGRSLRPRTGRDQLVFARAAAGALVVSMLVMGAQGGVATHGYPAILRTYGESPGNLQQLTWLRWHSGGVVYVGPNNQLFPVEFAMERPIFPAVQPKILNTQDQRDAAILGSTIAAGSSWLNAGPIVIADAEPEWNLPAPAILVYEYPYFVQLLRLGDGLLYASYSPAENPTLTYNVTLENAPVKNSTIVGDSLVDTFDYPRLHVVKTTTIDAQGAVNITLQYSFSDATVHGLELNAVSPQASVGSVTPVSLGSTSVATIDQSYWINSGTRVVNSYVTTERLVAPGTVATTHYVPSNSFGLPEVESVLHATDGSVLNYTVYLEFEIAGLSPGAVTPVDEASVMAAAGIQWAVVARSVNSNTISRFANDPNFSLYGQSNAYDFYSVVESP